VEIGQEPGVIQGLQPGFTNVEISSWEASFPDLKYALDRKGAVMDVFSVIILGIAGIGILNMLLMAVFERTREIGLRQALGARPADVLLQFLIEAVVLAALGGAIGIVLAIGASIGLSDLMNVPYVFNPGVNLLSFVFSAGIGVPDQAHDHAMHTSVGTAIQQFECRHVRTGCAARQDGVLARVDRCDFAIGGGRHRHGLHQHIQSDASPRRKV